MANNIEIIDSGRLERLKREKRPNYRKKDFYARRVRVMKNYTQFILYGRQSIYGLFAMFGIISFRFFNEFILLSENYMQKV